MNDAPAKCDLGSVMRVLQKKGCTAQESHPRVSKVYRENFLSDGCVPVENVNKINWHQ